MSEDFIEINADLHIHGLYAGGTSEKMIPKIIAENAPLKGIQLIGTGDILNKHWLKLIKEQLKEIQDGIFEYKNGTKFILQTEIEDKNRVHHIILFPSLSKLEEVYENFSKYCKDLDTDGRPKIHLSGEEILEICNLAGCLVGFSHAFTPYFGLYSKFNSYKECYGKYWDKVYFMELGLSADTNMADRIEELQDITFTSNSDCHSPWPNKLGREITRFKVKEISFEEIKKALIRSNGRGPTLNVKFDPREGKYHKTRCTGCLLFFEPKKAEKYNWKCPNCGKPIKKGVDYRIEELAKWKEPKHPKHRPPCIHIIPLSEIISLAYNIKNSWSERVQEKWREFVNKFNNELNVLLNVDISELESIDKSVAELIFAFRSGKFQYIPGGAGIYGIPVPPGKKIEIKYFKDSQKRLIDY
ncbi:MAG: TIGR00375 family protein [Candidatus Aenigmatarchaeota archaeon]